MSTSTLSISLITALAFAPACTRVHQIDAREPMPTSRIHHARGAVEGAGIGLLAGALIGALVTSPTPGCDQYTYDFCPDTVRGALDVGVAGVIVGALIGGAMGSRDVYVPAPRRD